MESITLLIEQIVEYMGAFGFVAGFLLVLLESILPPVPLGFVVGLNMLSFGKVFGFLISYIATLIGCMASFFLFRHLFKDKFMHWFPKGKQKTIKKWMDKLSNIDFNTLVVLFALPITPSFLVNIAGGLSDISYRKYLIAMLIGKPAMLLCYGFITVSIIESLSNPINLLIIVLLAFVAYLISKIIERIVKVEE